MKLITRPLLIFSAAAIVLTILFRYLLSASVAAQSDIAITVLAVIYTVCMFLCGLYFGGKEARSLPINDVGFRYHFATYLIVNIIAELWFALGANAPAESIDSVHYTALVWGVFIVAHFVVFLISRKQTIANIDRDKLFD